MFDNDFIRMVFMPMLVVVLIVVSLAFVGSCKSAKIYNLQNETNWTCSDFFWASDQINSQSQTIKLTD